MDDHQRAFAHGGHNHGWRSSPRSTRRHLVSDPESLLMFIDRDMTITYQNWTGRRHQQAAWSVLCDTGSLFNRAGHLPRDHVQSIEVAELFALASSLEVALAMVRTGWGIRRVVICMHSASLSDRICEEAWTIDRLGWPARVTGELVDWIHVLHDCHLMTQALFHGRGVTVNFWRVPVRNLVEARGLLERYL